MIVRIYLNGNEKWDEKVFIEIDLPVMPRKGEAVELSEVDYLKFVALLKCDLVHADFNYDCFFYTKSHERCYEIENADWFINIACFTRVIDVLQLWSDAASSYVPCVELGDPYNLL